MIYYGQVVPRNNISIYHIRIHVVMVITLIILVRL